MEINAKLASEFYESGPLANTDEWRYEGDESLGNSSRHADYLMVLEHRASGWRYGIRYGIGLDKHQGDTLPWEGPWTSERDVVAMEGPLVPVVITQTRWKLP